MDDALQYCLKYSFDMDEFALDLLLMKLSYSFLILDALLFFLAVGALSALLLLLLFIGAVAVIALN